MIKRIIFFILLVTIFFSIIPATQAADQQGLNYTLLKNEYIKNHPEQAIIPFPWEPSTSLKVLPFNYEIPAGPANNFSMTTCRNQFESASFIITSRKDISGIGIQIHDLRNVQGNTLPADAINTRLVKVWYQAAANDIWAGTPGFYLTPELLLKDDTLVKVDYVNKINFLKVSINGIEQYIDISKPTAVFPSNAQIHDTLSLQPFSLKANENKQIWLTVHVPDDTQAGIYYGDITITAPSEIPVIMNFSITVLPFDLEPPPIEYALYYRGVIPPTLKAGIDSEWKTPQQYAIELQNMKEHGVSYPTLHQGNDTKLGIVLTLRNQSGLPNDHIYFSNTGTGNTTSEELLAALKGTVMDLENATSPYGYRDVYIYGKDEASGVVLRSERLAWETVHSTGAKVFVAVNTPDAVDIVGDILDVAVTSGSLNTTLAAEWNSNGNKIFSYANPQVGLENPEIYRRNYGFALWNAGYDGAMNYAYQHGFGSSIWNDYDDIVGHSRDLVFAYPTSDGVIDTIQWEGWREGVDDTRYVASLIIKEGSDTSARALVSNSLSKGEDVASIREKVIGQILSQTNQPPVLAPVGNKTVSSGNLLNFTVSATDPDGNSLTYSAANLPTNATFNLATRSFTWTPATSQVGTYNVTFRVTDGSLSDTESVNISVTSVNRAPVLAPIGNKTVSTGNLLNFTVSATDSDGNNLTYTAANLPTNATFNVTTRSFAWTPTTAQVGTYNVTFRVTDGSLSDTESVNISVTAANRAPVLAAIGSKTVSTGNLLNFTVSASDPDGNSLTYSAANLPTNATFNLTTRSFAWTPTTAQVGTYNVTFRVTDGSLSDTESVNISVTAVNHPPVLDPIGNKTVSMGNLLNFTVSATDPDGNSLTYSAANLPTNATFNLTTRSFAWTPTTSQVGTYNVTFRVTDGSLSDTESVNISVTLANRAPVLAAIGSKTVNTGNLLNFTVSATDSDGNNLTYTAANLPTNATFNITTRSFAWTPTTAQVGTYNVTFRVTDGSLSDTESVNISVTAVNHPPVLAPIGSKTVSTGNLLNFAVSASDPDSTSLTNSAADLPAVASSSPTSRLFAWIPGSLLRIFQTGKQGDIPTGGNGIENGQTRGGGISPESLVYSATGIPSGATFNTASRSFAWTPTTSQVGTYKVTFRVTDGSLSDTESVNIIVNTVNRAPVLTAVPPQTVGAGSVLNFAVSATDPDSNSLTYSASNLPANANFNPTTRMFAWTPTTSQAGTYFVIFRVTDGILSNTESVKITVTTVPGSQNSIASPSQSTKRSQIFIKLE